MDLRFAAPLDKAKFDCKKCPVAQRQGRRCETAGPKAFQHLPGKKGTLSVDRSGNAYAFCPGKATWFPEIVELYEQCLVAYRTGILPKAGSFEDQDWAFVEAFPAFADKWAERDYGRVWGDVNEFAPQVLKALGRMLGVIKR